MTSLLSQAKQFQAVVIGASAGALDALMHILPKLPANFPLPIIIVVHLPPDKKNILPELFSDRCALTIQEAEDKEPIQAGHVYFAPPDYHLLVESSGDLSLSTEHPVMFSRPSIDVLFESAADIYGQKLIAIVLTGANTDGSKGLRAVIDAGGTGLVQDPENAHSSYMPHAALSACPEASMLPLEMIVEYLRKVAM